MATTTTEFTEEMIFAAARETAVLVDRSALGLLKATGDTRLDLIHRMSTQAVNGLKNGEGRATVLTTDIGRIIDRLILYVTGESVYMLTSENNSDAVARYLMRYVFFMDDFHLEDKSPNTAVLAVYGPQAGEKLSAAGIHFEEIPLHHWRPVEVGGKSAFLHRTDPVNEDGYFIICHLEDKTVICQHLIQNGIPLADEDTFEAIRIESGLPRFGRELTGDYIPLEAELWDDVSFHKGCYIGQEVIARMESRGQIAKKLVRLRPSALVAAGQEITAGGKKVGVITSAAVGPDGVVALGYVKTAVLEQSLPLLSGSVPIIKM
ncbi:MAG: YgfZ/GcvT domain-containing protein [Anaerolineae bacterium]